MSEAQTANLSSQSPDPRIASLTREIDVLEGAMRTGRWVRIILALAIVGFTLAMAWRFVGLANKLQSEENMAELMKVGQKRFESQLPLVRTQLKLLVDETSPGVTQAFYSQAKSDLPEFMAAMRVQRDPLVENLKRKLTVRLNEKYLAMAHEQEELIRENIPEAENDAVLAKIEEQFNKMFAKLIQKYYIDQLEGQMAVMFQAWDDFPAEQHGPNDPPLPDILIGHLLEVVSAKLASTDVRPTLMPRVPNGDAATSEPDVETPVPTPENSSSQTQTTTGPRVAVAAPNAISEPVPPEPVEEDASIK